MAKILGESIGLVQNDIPQKIFASESSPSFPPHVLIPCVYSPATDQQPIIHFSDPLSYITLGCFSMSRNPLVVALDDSLYH